MKTKLGAAIAVALTLATILAPIAMAGGKVFGAASVNSASTIPE